MRVNSLQHFECNKRLDNQISIISVLIFSVVTFYGIVRFVTMDASRLHPTNGYVVLEP